MIGGRIRQNPLKVRAIEPTVLPHCQAIPLASYIRVALRRADHKNVARERWLPHRAKRLGVRQSSGVVGGGWGIPADQVAGVVKRFALRGANCQTGLATLA